MTAQPSLFDDADTAATARRAADLTVWQATFTRAHYSPQFPNGWTCPDCGQVEATPYALQVNHGWDPLTAGSRPYRQGQCARQWLLGSQSAAAVERAAGGAA